MTEQQHLGLDALADLLVAEGSEADVDHVSRCAGCAARLAELDEAQLPVATALAALPAPPLPDGLAARLSAALEAAGPLPASEPLNGPDRPTAEPPPDEREDFDHAGSGRAAGETVTPLYGSSRRSARSRRTWLPAAAVAVLALSGAALAVSSLSGGGGDDTASTTSESAGGGAAPQQDASVGVVTNDSGRDYAAGEQVFDELLPQVLAGRAGPADAAPMSAPVPSPAEDVDANAESGLAGASAGGLERLRDPAALEACLSALVPADGSVRPLAVDYAAYAGQPALVVVLPTADPASLDVFVVGAGCAPGNDSTLFFTRVDRP